jgi:hypothetical protein
LSIIFVLLLRVRDDGLDGRAGILLGVRGDVIKAYPFVALAFVLRVIEVTWPWAYLVIRSSRSTVTTMIAVPP